jgi:hypothetical protein
MANVSKVQLHNHVLFGESRTHLIVNCSPVIWRHIDHLIIVLNHPPRLDLTETRRSPRHVLAGDAGSAMV